MNGGSSASYLVCALSVPLFCTLFIRGGNTRTFSLPGEGRDHFHCAVEPSPGHIRCRKMHFWGFEVSGLCRGTRRLELQSLSLFKHPFAISGENLSSDEHLPSSQKQLQAKINKNPRT